MFLRLENTPSWRLYLKLCSSVERLIKSDKMNAKILKDFKRFSVFFRGNDIQRNALYTLFLALVWRWPWFGASYL